MSIAPSNIPAAHEITLISAQKCLTGQRTSVLCAVRCLFVLTWVVMLQRSGEPIGAFGRWALTMVLDGSPAFASASGLARRHYKAGITDRNCVRALLYDHTKQKFASCEAVMRDAKVPALDCTSKPLAYDVLMHMRLIAGEPIFEMPKIFKRGLRQCFCQASGIAELSNFERCPPSKRCLTCLKGAAKCSEGILQDAKHLQAGKHLQSSKLEWLTCLFALCSYWNMSEWAGRGASYENAHSLDRLGQACEDVASFQHYHGQVGSLDSPPCSSIFAHNQLWLSSPALPLLCTGSAGNLNQAPTSLQP